MKLVSPKHSQRRLSWIWLILAIFFANELLWSCLTPPWQAPDEIAHYGYVESLFYERAFPILGKTVLSQRVQAIGPVEQSTDPGNAINADYSPSTFINWIAQHPPLYYLALEPLYAFLPHDNPLGCIFILRLISMLLGCVTLWFSHKTLQILLPDTPTDRPPNPGNGILRKAILVGMAFLPSFSSISAAMNNDNLVFMLSSILMYLSVKSFQIIEDGKYIHQIHVSLQTGLILGLLALTKITALPLFGAIFLLEIIMGVRAWMNVRGSGIRKEKSAILKKYFKNQLAIFGTAIIISGWWYVRNLQFYGMLLPSIGSFAAANPQLAANFPTLVKMFPETSGTVALPNATWWDFWVKENFAWEYYKNVWGAFGQFFFRLFSWQYVVIAALTLLSVCGYLKVAMVFPKTFFGRARETLRISYQKFLEWNGWPMLLPLLAIAAGIVSELFQIYRARGFLGALQGRYLFSVLLPFMYFFILGIGHLIPKKYLPSGMKLLMTFFVLNGFVAVMYRIIPEFF